MENLSNYAQNIKRKIEEHTSKLAIKSLPLHFFYIIMRFTL